MADKYWQPKALAVAQISSGSIDSVDGTPSNDTFTVTIGGIAVSVTGDTDVATTAAALAAALNASTHIYFSVITWTNPSAGTITGTADTAEVPFTAVLSHTGGTGTVTDFSTSTSPTGPHTISEADNWGGTLPSNADELVFRDGDTNICWGLETLTTNNHLVYPEASYTGRYGLDRSQFATSADGATTDDSAPEYRPVYLQLDMDRIEVGAHLGPGTPAGSTRVMLDDDSGSATQIVIHGTANAGAESGKPPVRILTNSASANFDVRSGSVGIGVDEPGETSTIGNISVQGGSAYIGSGVTLTSITLSDGVLEADIGTATATTALIHGGRATLNGDQVITTLKATGGRTTCNITGTIGTVEHEGGTVDFSQSAEARTVTTYNLHRGATLIGDDDVLTITTLNEPDGPYQISVS